MDKGTIGEETKLMRLKLLNTYLEGQGKPSFNSWDDVMKTMHSFASDSEALASKENIALVQKVNEVNEAINNYYTAHTSPIQNLNGAVDGFFNPSTANSVSTAIACSFVYSSNSLGLLIFLIGRVPSSFFGCV